MLNLMRMVTQLLPEKHWSLYLNQTQPPDIHGTMMRLLSMVFSVLNLIINKIRVAENVWSAVVAQNISSSLPVRMKEKEFSSHAIPS